MFKVNDKVRFKEKYRNSEYYGTIGRNEGVILMPSPYYHEDYEARVLVSWNDGNITEPMLSVLELISTTYKIV